MARNENQTDSRTAGGVRRNCILGTAGHIDHGKSALVLALTGTDPDRLAEEKTRGMTIVLGFAQMQLPGETADAAPRCVGIVDVPGHERFVRTMVAGATGIDLGMLVVAADDGVMPQTREHVEILDLLGLQTGLIAINKADLVSAEQVASVRQGIATLVKGTMLESWAIIPTSAKSGQGLDEVKAEIGSLMDALPPRRSSAVFRLAIDRVFTIRGRGTVVTGSVLAGRVESGVTLELQPGGLTSKVREVQTHGEAVRGVGASQRAALNLTGIEREGILHGMELATPGYLTPCRYVDARVRILPRREKPLATRSRVRVSIGTADVLASIVVVGGSEIEPGGDAPVQLQFREPVVSAFGQRFVIRTESAQSTIGGGRVVRPVSRRIRPSRREEYEALVQAESTDAFARFEEAIRYGGFASRSAMRLACETGIEPEKIQGLMGQLRDGERLTVLGSLEVHRATVEAIQSRTLAFLERHHEQNPTEPGALRDRLIGWIEKRSAPGCGKPILTQLETAGQVVRQGPYIAHHEFRTALSPEDAALLQKLITEIETAAFDPPVWTKLKSTAGLSKQRSKMLEDLAKCEPRLAPFAPGRYISTQAVAAAKETVRKLGRSRPFKLAEVRDELKLSRRVVQPLLEYLDRVQFTKRVGDERVLVEGDK
ncbi:MAG: selenocysteine-specific translation elongation factor [Planctomycetota bacterium]